MRRGAIKIRACLCGQVYRVIELDLPAGKTPAFFPPHTSQAVKNCINCDRLLRADILAGLKTLPTLAAFTGTEKDFAPDR